MRIPGMRKVTCLVVPVLVMSLAAACAARKGTGRGEVPPVVIGVIDFEADNMNLTEARKVTDGVLLALGRQEGISVVQREEMETIFREKGFRLPVPCDTNDCISGVGKVLSAAMMVAGKVSRAGNFYHLEVRLINVATSRMVNHAFCDVRGIEDLLAGGVESVVSDLVSGIGSGAAPAP